MATQLKWHLYLARALIDKNGLQPGPNDQVIPIHPISPSDNAKNDFTGHASLTFTDSNGKYRGSVVSHWSNVRLERLFKNITPEIWVYNPTTLRELGAALIERYALPLEPNMIVDGPFDPTILPQQVTLKTLRSHVVPADDEIEITVNRGEVDIGTLFTKTDLTSPGVPYTLLSGRASAEVSYVLDCTPDLPEQYALLQTYPSAVIDPALYDNAAVQLLVSLINERSEDGKAFYSTGLAADYNFSGSKLVFVGNPKNFVHPENKPWSPKPEVGYDRVIVIQFSDANIGRAGYGFFHFYEVS